MYAFDRLPLRTAEALLAIERKAQHALRSRHHFADAGPVAGPDRHHRSGQDLSEWKDYIFPRIGGKNPDGTPRRVTTMFFTHEIPMAMKHIEDKGGEPPGLRWYNETWRPAAGAVSSARIVSPSGQPRPFGGG